MRQEKGVGFVDHDLAKEAKPMESGAPLASPGDPSWFQLDLGTHFPPAPLGILPVISICKEHIQSQSCGGSG